MASVPVWARLGFLGLLVAATLAYIVQPEGFTRGGLVHGDGVDHYVYLTSILGDGDVDFRDDRAALAADARPGNPHGIGTALVWLPLFGPLQLVLQDDTSPILQRIVFFSSPLLAWLGLLLVFDWLRRSFADAIAFLAAVLVALTTALPWYAVRQSCYDHAISVFFAAAFVWLASVGTKPRSIWIGGVLGLAALVRPQEALWGLLWLYLCLHRYSRGRNPRARSDLLVVAATATLVFLPQLVVWRLIYGEWLLVPQGPEFLLWHSSKWEEVLFSSKNGLFSITWSCGLAILGLVIGAWSRCAALEVKPICRGMLLVFLAQVYLCGASEDWWAGWSYSNRRLLGFTPGFALGLATLIHTVCGESLRHRYRTGLALLGFSLLTRINFSNMAGFSSGELQRDRPQDFHAAAERALGPAAARLYDRIGNPGAFPANLWFAYRGGVELRRYDIAVGWELLRTRGDDKQRDRLLLTEPRFALGGFLPPEQLGDHACSRLDRHNGGFHIPLRQPLRLDARLWVHAAGPEELRVEVGGSEVLRAQVVPGWQALDFTIAPELLRAGSSFAKVLALQPGNLCFAWIDLKLSDPA